MCLLQRPTSLRQAQLPRYGHKHDVCARSPLAFGPCASAGDQSAAAAKLKAVEVAMLKNMGPQAGQGRFDSAAAGSDKAKARKDDRSGLMVQADKVAAAQARVRTAVCWQGCLCAGGAG